MNNPTSWSEIRNIIFSCKECLKQYRKVTVVNRRLDTYSDPNSSANVEVLFVSEAPPGGRTIGDFFDIR
jgi:hypothetical protein